jgi:Planctomycete cytochrome C
MKSVNLRKIVTLILIVGLLSACGTQPADTPASASQPTEEAVPATEVPVEPTAIPATAAAQPTEESTAEAAPATGVSFANDVLPILNSRCLNCHGGDRIQEGLLLRTHAEVMAGSDNGPVIAPGDASNSLLVELISSQKMPKRGPKLTPPQTQLIIDWVNQGALDN